MCFQANGGHELVVNDQDTAAMREGGRLVHFKAALEVPQTQAVKLPRALGVCGCRLPGCIRHSCNFRKSLSSFLSVQKWTVHQTAAGGLSRARPYSAVNDALPQITFPK